MVAILMEPGYDDSVWGKNQYAGLVAQLRSKRIAFIEVSDVCPADAQAVFVIGANYEWVRDSITRLNRGGWHPILICNQSEHIPGCLYSCVCSDVDASMRNLLEALRRKSKTRPALYGAGASSIADVSRENSLFSWWDDSFSDIRVFRNEGSLSDCFERFFEVRQAFDSVICANDYAAVSLVRAMSMRDPEYLKNLTVISCAGTKISEYYRQYIDSLSMSFEPYAKAAMYVLECMQKNPFISGMTVSIRWNQDMQEATGRQEAVYLPAQTDKDIFYDDPEIADMLVVDRFLTLSDSLDERIFRMLLKGDTLQSIAEECYLSEGTVRYRIRRITQLCGAQDKAQLTGLLKTYLRGLSGQTENRGFF